MVDVWSALGLACHVLPVESISCCYAVLALFAFDFFFVAECFDRVVCVCAAVHTSIFGCSGSDWVLIAFLLNFVREMVNECMSALHWLLLHTALQ